ncbi:MAG: zinc-dependent metalloprotease, partial [Betaproteobacteria bacterium]
LEKKDPKAEVSEPKQPILVWMDRNIPEEHRAAVREGILEWNKAFERAGFRNAVEVRQQPADADWSTLEGTRHIAVRWFALQGPGATAVGPSQSDPRSGEILRGAAIIPENWVRIGNAFLTDQQPRLSGGTGVEGFNAAPPSLDAMLAQDQCTYAVGALEQTAFALELLASRGDITPGSPEARRFIHGSLKDVVMHEVGHAIGLRHNFRASTGIKFEQLRDAAFTAQRGISNSVMDYNARNVPLAGEKVADYFQTTLGSYDYWAIEYAYREIAPEQEAAELARIAGRSATDPALAYATDEDVIPQLGGGIDPRVNQFDLGDDPMAYYKRSFALTRELWARTQKRELVAGDAYTVYRRNLQRGLAQFASAVSPLSKYVGGVYTSRQVAGPQPAALMTPVPAGQQREALALLTREVFSSDSFRFDPAFMTRLGVDHLERLDRIDRNAPSSTDFSLATAVLTVQRTALDQLMSDTVAARLADAESKVSDRRQLLSLGEVHSQLADAVWSELKSGREIDSLRRNLQREHVKRLAAGLVRPSSAVAADIRAVNRQVAVRLQADLQRAAGNGALSPTTRAHLSESASVLADALRAPLIKQGV